MKANPKTTWEEWEGGPNIGATEQKISAALGALLLLWGLKSGRGGWLKLLLAGLMFQRAANRECPLYRVLGIDASGDDADTFDILPIADAKK